MEIKIDLEYLRKQKLFVATPCYGGMCSGAYANSIAQLKALCAANGIELQLYMLFNESLITRARNYCCDEFMRSGYTHLFFIDSDIEFNAQDVIAMLALQTDESPYDIITASYPKKTISWEKVVTAVNKGMADEDPNVLNKYVGDYVFNPIVTGENVEIRLDEPVQVAEAGTGFMMIRRKTLELFDKEYPQYKYLPDHVRSAHFDGTREITQYFQAEVDPASRRYLSEDYWFCQKMREINGTVWLCPWIALKHYGTMVFGGSLMDIAAIGAHPTADREKLGKK